MRFAGHANVLYGYATACFHLGNQPEAHKYYRFLLSMEPDHSKFDEICFNLGIIEKSHYQNNTKAVEFFEHAHQATAYKQISKLEILYQIANTYALMVSEEQKNKSLAEKYYKEILEKLVGSNCFVNGNFVGLGGSNSSVNLSRSNEEKLKAVTLTELGWLQFQKYEDIEKRERAIQMLEFSRHIFDNMKTQFIRDQQSNTFNDFYDPKLQWV